MTYDVDHFIGKYEVIPEEKWCTGNYTDPEGRHCASGFCEEPSGWFGEEYSALIRIFSSIDSTPAVINDGSSLKFQQETPKQRILAALTEIKKCEVGK